MASCAGVSAGNPIVCGIVSERSRVPGHRGQSDLVMPDAVKCRGVLAWLGQWHRLPNAFDCHCVPRYLRQCDLGHASLSVL